MKKLLIICAALLISAPVMAAWNDVHVTDANTLALWHLDETTGAASAADASGNGNTAVIPNPNGAYQLDPNLSWAAGHGGGFGNALTTWWNSSSDLNQGSLYRDLSTSDGLHH